MLCTFDYDVVTAVSQLLIHGYVMLCYVMHTTLGFRFFAAISLFSESKSETITG